jgi:hypothetical protein
MADSYEVGTLPNPFFNQANQFIPRSFHDIIKWSRYITTQAPTTTEVIRKLSSYPITDFLMDSDQELTVDTYKKIFKSIKFKEKLCDFGFDFYTLGNVYTSIYFPIDRHLHCPSCKSSYEVKAAMRSGFAAFKKWVFQGECPNCLQKVNYKVVDTKSRDISRINLVKWKPEHVSLNHNPVTGESEFYYQIPGDVKRKIMQGDPLFLATVPWSMVEAVRFGKDYMFDPSNIYHMKSISMGSMVDGLGIPPLISHYGLVFYQQMLRKANEAVAAEHMVPLRVLFPQQTSAQGDPIAQMSMRGFAKNMKKTMRQMKTDPNHILISPVQIGYQQLGGQGRSLLVNQELQYAEEQQLMSMGVSRELLSGTTNWTSSTVGLRLLENTMNNYVGQVSELINWVMEKIAQYLAIEITDVKLVPFKLTDNEALKAAMLDMWKAKVVSASTLLEAYGMDYNEELDKMGRDQVAVSEKEIEVKDLVDKAMYMKSKGLSSDKDSSGYEDNRKEAYAIAKKVLAAGTPEAQRDILMEIQHNDPTLYQTVMGVLNDLPQPGSSEEQPGAQNEQDQSAGNQQ